MESSSTVPRGRHAPPLEVRRSVARGRLFAAAASVFAAHGYADASAEAIARGAGMSKATFYEHFANKEECILALFDAATEHVIAAMGAAARAAGADPLARLRAGTRAFLDELAAHPDQSQTLVVEIIGAGPRAAERRDAVMARFAEVLDAENATAARGGGLPRFASPDDAFAAVGAITELASRALRLCRPRDLRELEPVIERTILGLLSQAPARAVSRPRVAALAAIDAEVVACRRCPRLVAWREQVARVKRAAFAGERYWGRPVPGFGDPDARILVVGLAPAAHGGNRTGRVFTGDRSGDWLFAALWRAGLANQPDARARDDGLALRGCYVAAAVRCAPPANRPLPSERDACLPYLERELAALGDVRVVLCLGAYAWDCALRARAALGEPAPRPRPRFGHGAELAAGRWPLIGCFHPSQQNTFTGRLTEPMMDTVLARARTLAELDG